MLYVFHGTDAQKSRAAMHTLVDQLLVRKPDASQFRLETDDVNAAALDEFIGGQGLFESKYIVVLDHVFEDLRAREDVLTRLEDIATSDNLFVLLEEKIDANTKKKIEKYAADVRAFDLPKTSGEEFNVFALTDALGRRDKKNAWMIYRNALTAQKEPEEIHGLLFWQVKSMLIAAQASSAQEADQKPFVYKKASGFAQNYSFDELTQMSRDLVRIFHDARRHGKDLSVGLERYILEL